MKIGLLGGMVNNAYIMAKVLKHEGYDVRFIRDIEDTFIAHQPIWVDKRLEVQSRNLQCKTIDDCFDFDKENNWKAPSWYSEPFKSPSRSHSVYHINNPVRHLLARRRLNRNKLWEDTLNCFEDVDFIIACGVSASIIARFSNKPYLCWSYGGDLRKIMNLVPTQPGIKNWLFDNMTIQLLRDSYKNAKAIGFNYGQKIYCQGGIYKRNKEYHLDNADIIPFPAMYTKLTRNTQTSDYNQRIDDSIIRVLIPSRIDFNVKGHDKLLRALKELPNNKRFTFTITGWGNDLKKFKESIESANNLNKITILNTMLSRPLLHDLISQHDLVIDQFNLGIYGTATLEAMSLGVPVMVYINNKVTGHVEEPPIINCANEQDILNSLQQIEKSQLNLKDIGENCKKWANRYHGNDVFVKSIEKYF